MNPILTRRALLRRVRIVHQIPIDIMLQNEPACIKPVIKDLTPHNMSANTPTILPTLMPEPVMPKHLGVKIVRLKARMVHMALRALEEEKAVVVHELLSAVESTERVKVAACSIVDQF